MSSRAFLKVLPDLERDGLITAEQAVLIRAKYGSDAESGSNRMLLVFAILGSLLVGLGIMLIVAHNWDDLSRPVRTVLASLPVVIGQGLVWFTLQRKPEVAAWREGSAVFLACGLCACVALISQIYHISGELDGYLFTCSLLMLPLLYLPGSLIVALIYLAFITWYGCLVRFEFWSDGQRPWLLLLLLAAAAPSYLRHARLRGAGIGFWWYSLFVALAVGIASQLFTVDWEIEHMLGLMAFAGMFTLVPWLHPGRELRTWPWVLVGGTAMLVGFFIFSFRPIWDEIGSFEERGLGNDLIGIIAVVILAAVAYALSLKRRKPFARWPYPEGIWLFLLCYAVGLASASAAAILVNIALLIMGIITVRRGIDNDSFRRMNLGLAILSITILMRFFDEDLSFVLRGLAFIAIGAGFLFMNMRMVQQRKRDRHAP
jgi:uncharacterized membrane protein